MSAQVYLHPSVAGNPAVIRQIHAATGLRAVVGNNRHAPTLTRSAPAIPGHDPSVLEPFRVSFARVKAFNNPGPGPDGGDAA